MISTIRALFRKKNEKHRVLVQQAIAVARSLAETANSIGERYERLNGDHRVAQSRDGTR